MTIDVNKIQITNLNLINNTNKKVGFRGTTDPIPNDTVELSQKKKGISNGAKIAIGLGTIGAIVGGILLHKHYSKDVAQQAVNELTQAAKDLVTQGRITQKEADLFNQIHNLEGEEFVTKAYELIAKDMNLEKVPKLVVSMEDKGSTLGHTGQDITIFIKGYERAYGKEHAKEEIINIIRHELEHYKQDLIVFLQKGERAFQDAHYQHIMRYIENKALLRGASGEDLAAVIREEAERVGSSVRCGQHMEELYKAIYEHDSPINTIKKMTPCDFEKLNLTQEEKAKADEYLEGLQTYMRNCFPDNYLVNGRWNDSVIRGNDVAERLVTSYCNTGYWRNPIEIGARQVGDALRDKFIAFVEAMKQV